MNTINLQHALYEGKLEEEAKKIQAQEAELQKIQGKWDEWNTIDQTEQFVMMLSVAADTKLAALLMLFEQMNESQLKSKLSELNTLKNVIKSTMTGEYK